jgi:hypothetical protein
MCVWVRFSNAPSTLTYVPRELLNATARASKPKRRAHVSLRVGPKLDAACRPPLHECHGHGGIATCTRTPARSSPLPGGAVGRDAPTAHSLRIIIETGEYPRAFHIAMSVAFNSRIDWCTCWAQQ